MATTMPNPAPEAPAAVPDQPVVPQPPAAEPPPPQLFEKTDAGDGKVQIRLNTGEVFVGTPDELVDKLAGSTAHTHNYGKRLKGELTQFQQQQQQAQPPQPPAAAQMDPAEKMIADIGARALGFRDAEHQRQEYERLNAGQMEIQGRMVANQFMAENPDFAPSDYNSRVITEILQQNAMQETPQTLAMAHTWAKMHNLYEQVHVQPRPQPFQRPAAPPTVPGAPSSNVAPVTEQDLWSLPKEKLAEMMRPR